MTDNQINSYADQVGQDIRRDYGYPYRQVWTYTDTDEFTYFLGEKDIYAIEKVIYDKTVIATPADYTTDLEKGTVIFDPGFTVQAKELICWIIPNEFSELCAIQTALFIIRLSEGFQRGEPSINLAIIENKWFEAKKVASSFMGVETDGMGYIAAAENPYDVNKTFVQQDFDNNAYL